MPASPPAGRLAQGPSPQDFAEIERWHGCSRVYLSNEGRAALSRVLEAARNVVVWRGAFPALCEEKERLRALLRDLREELDQEADVDDGTPNLAARLLVMIDSEEAPPDA